MIPAGTEMVTVSGDHLGVFDAPQKAIIYRTKRRGRWLRLAQVEGVTVERFEPSIGTQASRRVYVSWATCKLERATAQTG